MSDWFHWFLGWAGLILGFSGLIFVHELGHFILAKWNGVRVYVFSLGMGPYLFSFTWNGTVYALSMIPIGGYVIMMGQDDMNANLASNKDTSDYRNKRPGQKAAILAAGAAFNLIFTICVFTVCYGVGMDVEPPRIGTIIPGRPLADAKIWPNGSKESLPANLQKGDLILEVNSVPVKTFVEAQLQISGTPQNEELFLKVERQPPGSANVQLVTVKTKHDNAFGASSIGLDHYKYKMELPLGFKTEDAMVVDDFDSLKNAKEVKEEPAYTAGLRNGDVLVRIEDPKSAIPSANVSELDDVVLACARSEGHEITFVVLRDGKTKDFKLSPIKDPKRDLWIVGLPMIQRRKVVDIDEQSEAYAKGLRVGHFVRGLEPENPNADVWKKGVLYWKKGADDKDILTMDLNVPEQGKLAFTQERDSSVFYKATSVGEAISTAWDDTLRFSGSVFAVLRGLFTRDISTDALSGAVGIGGAMFRVARTQTFINFMWFLGFISLNLGVLQFVPIPLLDGWHLLMVLIEKLKGSPVAPRIQEAFQYVGLFIVGGLLLLATYNDIRRLFVG